MIRPWTFIMLLWWKSQKMSKKQERERERSMNEGIKWKQHFVCGKRRKNVNNNKCWTANVNTISSSGNIRLDLWNSYAQNNLLLWDPLLGISTPYSIKVLCSYYRVGTGPDWGSNISPHFISPGLGPLLHKRATQARKITARSTLSL